MLFFISLSHCTSHFNSACIVWRDSHAGCNHCVCCLLPVRSMRCYIALLATLHIVDSNRPHSLDGKCLFCSCRCGACETSKTTQSGRRCDVHLLCTCSGSIRKSNGNLVWYVHVICFVFFFSLWRRRELWWRRWHRSSSSSSSHSSQHQKGWWSEWQWRQHA